MTYEDEVILRNVAAELDRATEAYGAFASPHEGYAVLLEEVHELWDEVRKRPGVRSRADMRREATQVAAMAVRFLRDCCDQ